MNYRKKELQRRPRKGVHDGGRRKNRTPQRTQKQELCESERRPGKIAYERAFQRYRQYDLQRNAEKDA